MLVILDLDQKALGLQVSHDLLAAFIPLHPLIPSAVLVDGAILIHHIDDRKVVPQSHLKIIGVMGRGDLYHAGSKIHLHIAVRHNGDFSAHQRQNNRFAHQVLVSRILRVNR